MLPGGPEADLVRARPGASVDAERTGHGAAVAHRHGEVVHGIVLPAAGRELPGEELGVRAAVRRRDDRPALDVGVLAGHVQLLRVARDEGAQQQAVGGESDRFHVRILLSGLPRGEYFSAFPAPSVPFVR